MKTLTTEEIKNLLTKKNIPNSYEIYTTLRMKAREVGIEVKGLAQSDIMKLLREHYEVNI